jgi:heptosyltransferase II
MRAHPADRRRSLLVRAVNWLGDAVMTTPALGAVRAAFPEDAVTLLARPAVAELFRHHPHVDEIVVYDKPGRHAGAAGTVRLTRELRRRRFDRAILFQNAFDAALLAFLAGIPDRWGYATDGRRVLLSRAVAVTEEVQSLHHVEYYLRLLSELGVPRPALPAMRLHVTDGERAAMRARLAGLGVPAGRRILGINPGATYGAAKRWYPERFAAVADALSEEWGAAVVLMGSKPEMPIAGEIAAAMRHRPADLSGRTSVRELMALLSLCAFLVTNDSGPMHIAAAEGVPLVSVFGPTNPRTTSPWTALAKIVRVDVDCSPCMRRECDRGHECMLGVTSDMVVSAARDLMAEAAHGLA